MSLDQLRNLDPKQYGFKGVADFLLYELISENDLGYEEFHARVDRRITRVLRSKHRDYLQVYSHDFAGDQSRELEIAGEVDQIVEREFKAEVEELTNYWRQQGKL
ncbi:MAG: hypothetical protein HY051_01430 [Candidatus Aenigmarchaeota archaeon]|nr:hypothetical protein [Candidatus Aenigmarchaeota archaeon]